MIILRDLAHYHGDDKGFTGRLTREKLALALRQMPALTIVLRAGFVLGPLLGGWAETPKNRTC